MSQLERPSEFICNSKWLCKTRRTQRASAQHYCECGGELIPLLSERGQELQRQREERMRICPRFRRIAGIVERNKPLVVRDIGEMAPHERGDP